MGVPSDESLMAAVAAGDLNAFEQLVTRHQRSAWSTAYRFLGNAADAEEVAQEAFLRVLDSADRYRPTAAFRTYLYRIVSRLCLDLARRQRLRRHGRFVDVAGDTPSAEETAVTKEREAAIQDAIDELAPGQKMAVILRYYEGLGYRDIAVALDTTVKGAERLLARARTALAKSLEGFLEE